MERDTTGKRKKKCITCNVLDDSDRNVRFRIETIQQTYSRICEKTFLRFHNVRLDFSLTCVLSPLLNRHADENYKNCLILCKNTLEKSMCLQGFEHSIPLPPIIFPCLLNMTSISFPNLLELSFIVVLAFPKASSIGFICNDNHRFFHLTQ